jgi:hypothetical protein
MSNKPTYDATTERHYCNMLQQFFKKCIISLTGIYLFGNRTNVGVLIKSLSKKFLAIPLMNLKAEDIYFEEECVPDTYASGKPS